MNWKAKLAAYLHDPPQRPVGRPNYEEKRERFLQLFGLDTKDLETFERSADWQAVSGLAPTPVNLWRPGPQCATKIRKQASLPMLTDIADQWVRTAAGGI